MDWNDKDSLDSSPNLSPSVPVYANRAFPFSVHAHFHTHPDHSRREGDIQPKETLTVWSPLRSLAVGFGVLLLLICILWTAHFVREKEAGEIIESGIVLTEAVGATGARSISNSLKPPISTNGICSLSEQSCLSIHCLFIPPAKGDVYRGQNRIPRICFEPAQIQETGTAGVVGGDN
jgi:hypothetical protein